MRMAPRPGNSRARGHQQSKPLSRATLLAHAVELLGEALALHPGSFVHEALALGVDEEEGAVEHAGGLGGGASSRASEQAGRRHRPKRPCCGRRRRCSDCRRGATSPEGRWGRTSRPLRPLDNPGVDGLELARKVDTDLAKPAGIARKRQHIALVVYLGSASGAACCTRRSDRPRRTSSLGMPSV